MKQTQSQTTAARLRLACTAAALAAVAACSKQGADGVPPTAAASSSTSVAMAQSPAPVTETTQAAPLLPAQPVQGYDQGRRDQQRLDAEHAHDRRERQEHDERQLQARADRDGDGQYGNVPQEPRNAQVAAATCQNCGVIESVDAVQVQGQANGVGAVAGGLGGALVGNRIAGNHNRALGGVIGAVGGGLLGNAIEKHERAATAYDVHVRMSDGSLRTVRQSAAPTIGERVRVEADGLHDRG